ncbi:MAG TPA: hypothetical protein VFR10_03590 [bacterium]|nr:hypothetical protein [bacterium]
MKARSILVTVLTISVLGATAFAQEAQKQTKPTTEKPATMHEKSAAMPADEGKSITVKGEVVDLVCYLDHEAQGAKHADCAKTCISSGLPVGIKTADGKVYMLVGDHKPLNEKLAAYAAKTITIRGKAVSRDGFNMIENAEIVEETKG